ncbi:hypothetical protein SHKM778_47730 [Streptomyces sp. KM77-8]|uniref:Lasso RiPP family leader peptide-containing protein n=1 Tax=Streptomyces haneummycinicus TaxID=3074435 RepID=A0AAT9HLT2_9ACTN
MLEYIQPEYVRPKTYTSPWYQRFPAPLTYRQSTLNSVFPGTDTYVPQSALGPVHSGEVLPPTVNE